MKNKEISFSPPNIQDEDIEQVINVLKSGWITTGQVTKKFEKALANYIGNDKVVGLSSCTAALEMTLRILGIGKGDEVIVPAYTYTATAAAVHHVGAKIVMIDIQQDNYEMDYNAISEKITPNTKAIIPVDIAGKPCDYKKIYEIIENKKDIFKSKGKLQQLFNRIIIVADAAHSFGAEYNGVKSGNYADFTCFSFHAVKNLTTGEGGAVTWKNNPLLDNEKIYNQFMLHSLHGQSKDALSKSKAGQWEYDIIEPLYKANMTDIQAAIGHSQLKRYDKTLKRREEIINLYNTFLRSEYIKPIQHFENNRNSSGHLYIINIDGIYQNKRDFIIEQMSKKGIACNVHYKPLPLLTAYKELGFVIDQFPNSFKMFQNEITLPLHTKLTDDDIHYISDTLLGIIKELRH
ncbi:DegT/DnrJ/EryC1/StrS family aminotransferase [Mammaliicoccus sciuri]|uniref:DegT/DnrJ/EryC1/StrS family aminotransferase n=1 Tax=Mammaliicoccus sciuri TaxID=1296 RepID=UPI00194E94A3|nr:DegT/DnrJ/EryC1/StrS aminotransferase family protein [Mammaliicoccus sciuri]